MPLKTDTIGREGRAEAATRPFSHLLAVALISLVLVSLALVTGLKDLRTLDRTLSGFIQERGLDILKNIQQTARHYFLLLGEGSDATMKDLAASGVWDEALSLRESMILYLLSLAQRIDLDREQGSMDEPLLSSLAGEEGISLLALLDSQGNITYQNRPIPEAFRERALRLITGGEEIQADLFGTAGEAPETRSLVVRRKQGEGGILFVLDGDDYRFWMARVAIRQAVEEVGLGPETRYLVVTDTRGRIVLQSGEPPISGKAPGGSAGRREEGAVDVAAPIRLNGPPALQALLRLSREGADLMLQRERERGLVFIGFMLLIALLSMAVLYRTQARHLALTREMERRLYRAERLSAMGRLAAGVAHEIRNPLNAISMACQRLRTDNLGQLRGVILGEIGRLNRIVEEFIAFSRSGRPVLKEGDIAALVREMALLMEEEAASRGIALQAVLPQSPVMIRMDADKIRQALLNILRNAMESIPDQGTITLALAQGERKTVTVRISDTGVGLSPREMAHIFEPDYTTKEKGLGLGLALAHEIIAGHDGEIRVTSRPGQGTTFEVVLPIGVQASTHEPQGEPRGAQPPEGPYRHRADS